MGEWGWNPYLSDSEAVLLISVLGTHLSIHSQPDTHQGHVLRRQTHLQVIPTGILPSSYLQKAHWPTSFECCPQTHTTTQYGLKQNHSLSSKHLFSSDHGTIIMHIKQVWNYSHIYLTLLPYLHTLKKVLSFHLQNDSSSQMITTSLVQLLWSYAPCLQPLAPLIYSKYQFQTRLHSAVLLPFHTSLYTYNLKAKFLCLNTKASMTGPMLLSDIP